MIKLKQAVVVEGRYDKNTLAQLIDAPIFETNGFGVMHDRTLLDFLRRVAEKRGLIVLTDSDGAGFVIRNFLKGALPKDKVLHAYIPDVAGKERRKAHAGKEGKLGVEGMKPAVLLDALHRAGATFVGLGAEEKNELSRADLYDLGLIGANSAARRAALLRALALPEHLSTTALLDVLRMLTTRDELETILRRCECPPPENA